MTTSAPLSTVAGHPNATSIRYPLAMMIDPMTMGLATGVQTAADGKLGHFLLSFHECHALTLLRKKIFSNPIDFIF